MVAVAQSHGMRGELPASVRRMENALLQWPAAPVGVAPGRGAGPAAVVGRRGAPLVAQSRLGCVSDSRRGFMSELLLDAARRRRSPATLPVFHAGRPPRNKGMRYPADPPTIEEIVTVMRHAGDGVHGRRLRGLIVVQWRAGLRICEALALAEG